MHIKLIYTTTDKKEVERILKSVGFGPLSHDEFLGSGRVRHHSDDSLVQVYCKQYRKSDFPGIYRSGNGMPITRICLEDMTNFPSIGKNGKNGKNGNGHSLCRTASLVYQSLVSKLMDPVTTDTIWFIR